MKKPFLILSIALILNLSTSALADPVEPGSLTITLTNSPVPGEVIPVAGVVFVEDTAAEGILDCIEEGGDSPGALLRHCLSGQPLFIRP